MSEFAEQLNSPAWWMSAVVVGIVLNVVSYYVTRHLDRGLSSISKAYEARSRRRRREHDAQVAVLRGNQFEQQMHMQYLNYVRLQALGFLVLGVFVMLLPVVLEASDVMRSGSVIVAGFSYAVSFRCVLLAQNGRDALAEARSVQAVPDKRIEQDAAC